MSLTVLYCYYSYKLSLNKYKIMLGSAVIRPHQVDKGFLLHESVTCYRSVVFPGPPFSSINKTDHHYIKEILLKVALS
jgi:hypothetical protein